MQVSVFEEFGHELQLFLVQHMYCTALHSPGTFVLNNATLEVALPCSKNSGRPVCMATAIIALNAQP